LILVPGTPTSEPQSSTERAFISEIFHSLSQPLTALHCSLDLALRRDRTLQQLRASVQAALEHAERLRQRLLLARALNAASEPAEPEAIDLGELLFELQADLSPLFECAGGRLELQRSGEAIFVCGNKSRLMQALFVFLEYLLRYSVVGEPLLMFLSAGEQGRAELRIEASSSLPIGRDDVPGALPCEMELARRTFVAAGGDFWSEEGDVKRSVWVATLPLR